MWIVLVNGKTHSMWDSLHKAEKQKRTLLNAGYKAVRLQKMEGVTCENGRYFV